MSGIPQAEARDRRSPVRQVSACVSATKELMSLKDLACVEMIIAKHMGAPGWVEFQQGKDTRLIQQAGPLLDKVWLTTGVLRNSCDEHMRDPNHAVEQNMAGV